MTAAQPPPVPPHELQGSFSASLTTTPPGWQGSIVQQYAGSFTVRPGRDDGRVSLTVPLQQALVFGEVFFPLADYLIVCRPQVEITGAELILQGRALERELRLTAADLRFAGLQGWFDCLATGPDSAAPFTCPYVHLEAEVETCVAAVPEPIPLPPLRLPPQGTTLIEIVDDLVASVVVVPYGTPTGLPAPISLLGFAEWSATLRLDRPLRRFRGEGTVRAEQSGTSGVSSFGKRLHIAFTVEFQEVSSPEQTPGWATFSPRMQTLLRQHFRSQPILGHGIAQATLSSYENRPSGSCRWTETVTVPLLVRGRPQADDMLWLTVEPDDTLPHIRQCADLSDGPEPHLLPVGFNPCTSSCLFAPVEIEARDGAQVRAEEAYVAPPPAPDQSHRQTVTRELRLTVLPPDRPGGPR